MSVAQARRYEKRYHDDLYSNNNLGDSGTWLAHPAKYAINALELIPDPECSHSLDLGAGIGRHTIPLAAYVAPKGIVTAVDLLPTATDKLKYNLSTASLHNVSIVTSDIEDYRLDKDKYDFVLSVSCIEHIPTKRRLVSFISKLQLATKVGGAHCFMMITDNIWMDAATGEYTAPITELNLSSDETISMLKHEYRMWNIKDISTKAWEVSENVQGRAMILKSTCVQFTAVNSRGE